MTTQYHEETMSMTLPMHLEELNDWEKELIARFHAHPILKKIQDPAQMSMDQLRMLLLQRRFLSLAFTVAYDLAIDGLGNDNDGQTKDADTEGIIQIARMILREEYPNHEGKLASHREHLVHDLRLLGVSRQQLTSVKPTLDTLRVLWSTYEFFTVDEPFHLYQVRMLSLLRFWGETLVSEEYGIFWPRLEQEGLKSQRDHPNHTHASTFYYPHWEHDARQTDFGPIEQYEKLDKWSHTDKLTYWLQKLLKNDKERIQHCARIEEELTITKMRFYDQFV